MLEGLLKFVLGVLVFALDCWIVMLGVGVFHTYYNAVPAIGFAPAVWATLVIKCAAKQNTFDLD